MVVADALTLEVQEHTALVPTEVDVELPYRIAYSVGAPHAGELRVRILAEGQPGWLVVAVPDLHLTPSGPSLPGTYTFEGVLRARHDGTARAFRADTVRLIAIAEGDERLVQPRDATAETTLQADWQPGLQVVVQDPHVALSPSGSFGLAMAEIRNTGNAPVETTATVRSAPDGCDAEISQPPTILAPGERGTLSIDISCERHPGAATLVARVTHALAQDTLRAGEPVEPSWDVGDPSGPGGQRVYGDAPRESRYDAPWGAVALVPGALALAAILRRRPMA